MYYVSGALVCSIDGCQRTGAIKAEAYPLIILCEPLSSLTKLTNITINNNTWNGNIYTDNSTNLTYIYPQYTTINEKNETVTNISNTPIIYNNETKQYYTYDQTTKNYYYITYNENPTTPNPSPSPTPDPDNPSVTPTPTPTPGGDTGDTTGILAVLVEIRDNMIQGFLDIKAAFVAGFADFSANFTLAIENLTLDIQNFFFKGMSGSPVDPNIPGGGSISTPETGGSDSSSGSGWSWNPLKWLTDLLKDIVEGIIKTIWKLITSLFGFLLWLLSLVGKLFPFIPGQAVLAVTSAVVIVAVIRIIKFMVWRFQLWASYDAWEMENATNAEMIKPLRRGLWFVLDRDYNAYDTLAVVDNLQKKFEEGDILTESEIISNQAPAGPLGLEVASKPTKKAQRRMSGQIKR